MRNQAERDEQTITIATTVALFLLVLVAGAVVALLTSWITDPPSALARTFAIATLAAATGISLRYAVRHRRP